MNEPFLVLDKTPIDSDWDDFSKMLNDIREFMSAHPDHELIPADDPGTSHARVARIGFAAFRTPTTEFAHENIVRMNRGENPIEWDEQQKYWSITLPNVRDSLFGKKGADLSLVSKVKTTQGRLEICRDLIKR